VQCEKSCVGEDSQSQMSHLLNVDGAAFALGLAVITHGRQVMAKKSQGRGAKRPRPTAKRDLVRGPKGSAYAKRTTRGRFKEMDDVGRSQKADKPRKAKKTIRSGYGDQGDERRGRKRSVAG